MGNENSRGTNYERYEREESVQEESINRAVDIALKRQKELYDSKYKALLKAQAQEQDKKRNESIEKAIEALDQQKSKYEAKYNELLQNQTPHQNLEILNRNIESLQMNSNSLYPTLEMRNNNVAPHPAYNGPSTSTAPQTFSYSTLAEISPAPVQNPQSTTANARFPASNLNPFIQQGPRLPGVNMEHLNQQGPRPRPMPQTRYSAASAPVSPAPVQNQSATTNTRFPVSNQNNVPQQRPDTSTGMTAPQTRKPNQPNRKTSNQAPNCKTCSSKLGELIFQCKNGHSSCRTCRIRNLNCGECKNPITDMRNITLEGLISDLILAESTANQNPYTRLNCPNAGDGCSLSFKKEDMESHLKECPFKEMDCPLACVFNIRKCTWRGKINHIVNHFNDIHPEHCVAEVDKEMTLLNTSDNHRTVYFTTLGPFNFLIHVKVGATQKCTFMTAQLLGTKISAAKWTYQFHIYNKQQPKRKYQFNGICHSNSVPVEKIFEEFNCAAIPSDAVQTFSVNNRMNYKFYLTKNTEANPDKKNNAGAKKNRNNNRGKFHKVATS